jgi:glyoxylase-like metal-dependent hydrolase (beta-lactamase superfamily II)
MKVQTIEFSKFKTTGQAMFGSTQEVQWKKLYPSDDQSLCTFALRSLVVDDGENMVIFDSGFGNLTTQLLEEYHIGDFKPSQEVLLGSGFSCEKFTHVIHTHLHLDHCGGSFASDESGNIIPIFSNADYYVSCQQLDVAGNPSNFEKDSFQPELISALSKFKSLKLLHDECFLFPWLELFFFSGHTQGLIIPVIHTPQHSLVFVGDLIPTMAHLILQSASSYDLNPILSVAERENFLEDAFENEFILFFQHDNYSECCSLKRDNNRIVPDECFTLDAIL